MTTIAEALIEVRADTSKVDSDISGAARSASSGGSKVGKAFAAGFAGAAVVGLAGFSFLKGAISEASDLGETINKSNVIFGKNAAVVRKWSRDSATAFGLSQNEALAAAAGFGDMFTQIGFTSTAATKMSKSTVRLAADLGSFNNLETADVADRMSAAFRGEYDSLQAVIPNINAARVESEALKETGKKLTANLTAQEKAAAVLAIVMKDGARATGDFERTSDGLANQQKILGAQWDNLKAKVGKALLPVMQSFTGYLTKEGLPALDRFADWFTSDGMDGLKTFAGNAKDVAGNVRDMVKWLNDLPDVAKLAALAGVVGGVGAMKLGSGKGALGSVGSALGMAKPTPVFVTNPGFGTGAGVPGKGGGVPGVVPGAVGTVASTIGKLPKFAALIPVGLGSSPGQDSLMQSLFGFGLDGDKASSGGVNQELSLPPGVTLPDKEFATSLAAIVASARETVGDVAGAFGKLPKTILTRFDLLGVPESKKAAKELARDYNLTPKEKRTLFEALGYTEARSKTQKLIDQYNLTPGSKTTAFKLDGIEGARSALINFSQQLAQIRSKTITVNTVFTESGRRFKEFANGTASAPGGMAWVGERGPELMRVPRGAEVVPNPRSRRIAAQSGSGGGGLHLISGTLTIDERGVAFIQGVAADEVDEAGNFGRTMERMRS